MRRLLITCLAAAAALAQAPAPDPIAADLERWKTFTAAPSDDPVWSRVKEAVQASLSRAEAALKAGRRQLALLSLAEARATLGATAYLRERPAAERKELPAFEAEWKRLGPQLSAAPDRRAFQAVRPAAERALAEASAAQVSVYYRASLDYGKSTAPESGLFYLGNAVAQRQLSEFVRGLREPAPGNPPPLHPLDAELDALEDELLALYRPPVSIDRHREFIGASAVLKEARELNAAGFLHGALLRYLEATLRMAALQSPVAPPRDALALKLADWDQRLSGSVDHSIARLLLESAQQDLENSGPEAPPAIAANVVREVLPRYVAALQSARAAARRPPAQATVTLVRWPYT